MKTHWKQLVNTDYLGAYSLPNGDDIIIKIINVEKSLVKGAGGRKEECIVASLDNNKPMILNRTNCKTIAKVHGSNYIQDWIGKHVQVFSSHTTLKGDEVECLRIREFIPQLKKPTLSQNNTSVWSNAVAKIVQVGFDAGIEAIEKRYTLTDEIKKELKDAATIS